jgi:hypothetical protein
LAARHGHGKLPGVSATFLGSLLIAEGLILAASRLFTLVYVLASETYIADEEKIPLANFLPWLLLSFALLAVLVWAGTQFRSAPEGPWTAANPLRRGILIAAFLFNAAVFARALVGIASSLGRGAEIIAAWVLVGAVSGLVSYAMVRRTGVRSRNVPG